MQRYFVVLLLVFNFTLYGANIYTIPSWSIDSGVTKSQNNTYTLSATIGQAESGVVMQNSSYKLSGGFWFPSLEHDICMVPIIMYLLD